MTQFGGFRVPPLGNVWESIKAALPENSPCMELVKTATGGGRGEGAGGGGGGGAGGGGGRGERVRFAQLGSGGTQGGSMGDSTELATMAESGGEWKLKTIDSGIALPYQTLCNVLIYSHFVLH